MDKKKRKRETAPSLVRTIRMAMGLTGQELAKLGSIDYGAVQRIESSRNIGAERVYKLAKALDIHPDLIFYSMGQIPKDKVNLVIKDPLRFKEIMDEEFAQPWKLTQTINYIQEVRNKIDQPKTNPEVAKMLSKLKPTEGD